MSAQAGQQGEAAIEELRALPVPAGWEMTTVGDAGQVRLGRQRSPKNRSANHPTKYVRAANITWDGLDLTDVLDMEFRPPERDTYRLRKGDVLLSEASGSPTEVGKPALWNDELEDCCFQNTVIRFRPQKVLPEFALRVFQHFARNGVFARVSKGVGIHHLSADRFSTMPFFLPPPKEQRRIVAKIDELFSDLDAGVVALERARANLKRYRASLLKSAVDGSLTADWRARHPDTEPASQLLKRILKERREKWEADQLAKFAAADKTPPNGWRSKYTCPQQLDVTVLPRLPSTWIWTGVQQCASDVTVGHVGPMKERYVDSGIPFLRSQNVRPLRYDRVGLKCIPEEFDNDLTKSRLYGGELLVVRSGNIGEACVYPEGEPIANCSDLVIARLLTGVVPQYAAIFVVSPFGKRLIGGKRTGSALSHFNVGAMSSSPIPLPPLAEQVQIVAEVSAKLSQIEAAETGIDHALHRAARLRQAILKQAFTGRLVPQNPSDEPASAVLYSVSQSAAKATPSTPTRRKKSPTPS